MLHLPWRIASHYAIGLLVAGLLLHTFCVMGLIVPMAVSGDSMRPTLREGKRLWVDRSAFLVRPPRRGELVVFRCPDRANEFCVKRVFGLPGDTVALINGELRLNPRQAGQGVEPSITDRALQGSDILPDGFEWARRELAAPPKSWVLSDGEYFVVGDNRAISEDSRNWVSPAGVDAKLVVGKPIGVR